MANSNQFKISINKAKAKNDKIYNLIFWNKIPLIAASFQDAKISVSSPDPDWIRIQSGPCIRIRIQEGKNDPQK